MLNKKKMVKRFDIICTHPLNSNIEIFYSFRYNYFKNHEDSDFKEKAKEYFKNISFDL